MRNNHLHVLRRLLFISFCLCFIMMKAQNPCNVRPSNRQMQMEMNTHLSIIDSIANVCSQEVSTIRNDVADMRAEMDSLANNTCKFISNTTKEPNWDKKSANRTFWSIIAMVVIFLITFCQTQKQIKAQHNDTIEKLAAEREHSQEQIESQRRNTDRHIKTQRNLIRQQISEMQRQSDARLASLEEMGNKIGSFTGEIQESVKHFERTYIGKDDRKFIEKLLSELETENAGLYQMLSEDFVNLEDLFKADKNKYAQGVLNIKTNINKIQNTLKIYSSTEPIPDAQAYLENLQKIANGPVFDIMDEQLVFYDLGKTFCDEISHVAIEIFNNYDLINTQIS